MPGLQEDTDFPGASVDSVQAIRIRACLKRELDISPVDLNNVVFKFHSISRLSSHPLSSRTGVVVEETELQAMSQLISKYSHFSTQTHPRREVIILTGTTGSLGVTHRFPNPPRGKCRENLLSRPWGHPRSSTRPRPLAPRRQTSPPLLSRHRSRRSWPPTPNPLRSKSHPHERIPHRLGGELQPTNPLLRTLAHQWRLQPAEPLTLHSRFPFQRNSSSARRSPPRRGHRCQQALQRNRCRSGNIRRI
ncbi:hypothetical protein BJ875DRAFT_77021 [Amylocarpus encephaloides]|uniref:Carrier domain-containing protein n=1 Tax=Amylocarpus encephaloides TaxID=45428 RepID=A0A9P7YF60_9HELO|nr:hypothetical protein BJ875DRAFT_77021 [Amylocarpus encephaloides]